jgi:osmotically-inducible protein OsmY
MLALELAAKLAMDPRTATANVRTEIFLGAAHLKGVVKGQGQHQAVLELAQQVPGITSINDLLTVVG